MPNPMTNKWISNSINAMLVEVYGEQVTITSHDYGYRIEDPETKRFCILDCHNYGRYGIGTLHLLNTILSPYIIADKGVCTTSTGQGPFNTAEYQSWHKEVMRYHAVKLINAMHSAFAPKCGSKLFKLLEVSPSPVQPACYVSFCGILAYHPWAIGSVDASLNTAPTKTDWLSAGTSPVPDISHVIALLCRS